MNEEELATGWIETFEFYALGLTQLVRKSEERSSNPVNHAFAGC